MTEDDKLRSQAQNSRLVHLNEQLVFPLLERNISITVESMCSMFRDEHQIEALVFDSRMLKKVAYITACKDLITELQSISRRGDAAVVKLQRE